MLSFHKPYKTSIAKAYVESALKSGELCGGKTFSKKCEAWLKDYFKSEEALLTPSCTDALEMAMILAGVGAGDEVIVPSYTFPSSATCVVLTGATPVFVDCCPDTMQLTPEIFEAAITDKTKAVVPMHYAGQTCDMEGIMQVAEKHNIIVVADAAQSMFAMHNGKPSASFGHMAAISFHETKNITSGEGGCLVINDARFAERACVVHEKGTNRKLFYRGQVDKYSWIDKGSSFVMSDLNAALLLSQLELGAEITEKRAAIWKAYQEALQPLEAEEKLKLCKPSASNEVNGHIFYILMNSAEECNALRGYLLDNNIQTTTHYVPLHSAIAGKKFGKVSGGMTHTDTGASRLLRLPVFADMEQKEIEYVVSHVNDYFKE